MDYTSNRFIRKTDVTASIGSNTLTIPLPTPMLDEVEIRDLTLSFANTSTAYAGVTAYLYDLNDSEVIEYYFDDVVQTTNYITIRVPRSCIPIGIMNPVLRIVFTHCVLADVLRAVATYTLRRYY